MFDIVILVGPNDIDIIKNQLEFTKKNIINYRKIYIVSNYIHSCIEGCEIISENLFEFNNDDIVSYIGDRSRTKWYLQQLLKLYAGIYIKDILDTYLVIDTDTFFLKPTTFQDENSIAFYNISSEYNDPYFKHMRRLHPSLKRVDKKYSGITHHMLFEKKYLLSLFDLIETYHNNQPFWKIFLKSIDKEQYDGSGASEYEIYFNFMLLYHPDDIKIRILNFKNVNNLMLLKQKNPYNYISYHWYSRGTLLERRAKSNNAKRAP